jgi:hypothetical protein
VAGNTYGNCIWEPNVHFWSLAFSIEKADREQSFCRGGSCYIPSTTAGQRITGLEQTNSAALLCRVQYPLTILVAAFILQKICTVSFDVGHISAKRGLRRFYAVQSYRKLPHCHSISVTYCQLYDIVSSECSQISTTEPVLTGTVNAFKTY